MSPANANGGPSRQLSGDKPANGEVKQRKRPGRVPVSCAECRRLKLRCDRKVPCETCVKRGCSAICPEGSLTTGKGNRLALADADELHKKVERLRNRVTTLEDALRKLQAAVSDDPHPLLQEGAADPKDDTMRQAAACGPSLSPEDEEFLDAFGTLTLGLRGESRFFGQTSRSEYLIHAPEYVPPCDPSTFVHLTPELVNVATGSLEMLCSDPEIKKQVLSRLPSLSRACRLCDLFVEYGDYLWCSLPRNQLFDEILGVIYRGTPASECNDLLSTHAVSLLFMVFALASLFDQSLPPYSTEAQEYYLLARAALRFAPPIQDTTLWSIQALVYMALFMEYCDCRPDHSTSHKAWIHTGFAVKLGHGIGLHVNSARWKLDEEATQRRSNVFWQLFLTDTWISFGFGRPPSISLSYVDCTMPKDTEEYINSEGHKEWSFHSWTWQYSKVLHTVMSTAFGCKIPPYSTVIDLDRKVRDFPIPWRMRVKCGLPEEINVSPALRIQRWLVMSCKESTLLNLHRPYFAQALNEQPQDLLRHRYGPSVMAIYRSGWRLIEGLKETWKKVPDVLSRMSLPWSQSLSGAIVMCLLVTRAPTSTLAQASLQELDRVCELFEQAVDSKIAANNVTIIQKLRRQAHEAMEKAESQDKSNPAFNELNQFGGKTHVLTAEYDVHFNDVRTSANGSISAPVLDVNATIGTISADAIHPTIVQDLRSFDGMNLDFPSLLGTMALGLPQSLDQQQPQQQQQQLPPQPQEMQPQNVQFNHSVFDGQYVRSFPDVYLGEDLFSAATPSSFSTAGTSPDAANMGPPPVLDATWQSFVEQLGF
ncbi:unnamed protein product [Somion occarium]|uniref:Zn(2)-C6 fungal-type domain-containing protein n=1 Tax=Somion occarium TaxID=3059160 RepID=A0ABP1CGB6_9APHY